MVTRAYGSMPLCTVNLSIHFYIWSEEYPEQPISPLTYVKPNCVISKNIPYHVVDGQNNVKNDYLFN